MAQTTTRPRPNLELLKARMQKGLSRGELAHLTGLSEKQVGLIERGVAKHPRAETIHSLAQVLDVDVFTLYPVERRFRR